MAVNESFDLAGRAGRLEAILMNPATAPVPAASLEEEMPPYGGGTPRLFVQGENDEFGSGDAVRSLTRPFPRGRTLVVVPGANHFFDGRLDEMQGAVCSWAEQRPWETRGSEGRQ